METRNNTYANIYYFRRICKIGGTEQFLYEMAKKYHKYDLTILYDEADLDQLIRLRKLVRCVHRKQGEIYHAKRAFYNFNIGAIDQIVADEHIFVSHAIYQELGYKPPINHPKITKLLAVSKYAEEQIKLQEQIMGVDKPIVQCYNPLTLEKPDKVMRLISACRLEDRTKGGDRTRRLINALDKYCEHTGKHYLWTIFTNSLDSPINSSNVAIMKPRVDVRPYIADSDWLVQISNNMESYCYTINEALGYGVGVVTTPLSVTKEFKIPPKAQIVLDWDCKNADEVAEQIFDSYEPFEYKPPKDGWDKLLVKEKSTYTPLFDKVKIKALKSYYDLELQRQMTNWDGAWEVSIERARRLVNQGLVRVIE